MAHTAHHSNFISEKTLSVYNLKGPALTCVEHCVAYAAPVNPRYTSVGMESTPSNSTPVYSACLTGASRAFISIKVANIE